MFAVEDFVVECLTALDDPTPTLAVKAVVERAISDPAAIDATLGPTDRGGIAALHRSERCTVLHIVWPPGVCLFPHDHRMWAVNGIYAGREDNTFYRRTPDGIVVSGGRELDAGDLAVLGPEVIHAVENPRRRATGAIHVYGGDFFATPRSQWDPPAWSERPFDVTDLERTLAEADAAARRDDPLT